MMHAVCKDRHLTASTFDHPALTKLVINRKPFSLG